MDPLTNTALRAHAPTTQCGWGHIAEDCHQIRPNKRAWAFGKLGHKAAYKFLPIRQSGHNYAVIALWNPATEGWRGLRPMAQISGPIASALR